ncbi:MAG: transglycosylase domain-containing protein [Bacteroidia bacterium]|nr:transglycosylase domain-containing protein [Bacteroidia bacterium]
MSWLPFLLRTVLQKHGIAYLRYESVIWNSPTSILFHKIILKKEPWHVQVDSLWVTLWPATVVKIAQGHLHKDTSTISPISQGKNIHSYLISLSPIQIILHELAQVDTLLIKKLAIEENLFVSFYKKGAFWVVSVEGDSLKIMGQGHLHEGGGSFSFPCTSVSQGGAYLRWDSLAGTFTLSENALTVTFSGWGWEAFHKRIARRPLRYRQAGLTLTYRASAESTAISLSPRDIPLQAEAHLRSYPRTGKVLLQLLIPEQPHAAFIQAFPEGFFTCLSRAQLGGSSSLALELTYDPALPETLALQVKWQPHNFGIITWPGLSPLSLREPLYYTPYGSTRRLWLSPENPDYLTFAQITPYVLHAVLHSEDGIFFYHNGFQKEHFIKAILENWRCRCFRRGAGTITMQLVRNLLLTREKTLARKVEEILLTAIIERFRLLSKERIAELYFNMVEWGPEVYGLTEASRFYFSKEPHELTIPEAIFLGVLLPAPKAYKYFLNRETGCAASSLAPHFRKIAHFLVWQNYLPSDTLEALSPERVCLRGPAWRPDTLPSFPPELP